MGARLDVVMRRRAALVQRAATERAVVVDIVRPWRRPLALLDAGIGLLRAASGQPAIVVLAIMLLARARHARLALWIGRVATAWRVYRTVRYRLPATQAK